MKKVVYWVCLLILLILVVSTMKLSEKNGRSFPVWDPLLPSWAASHLDEWGCYKNVTENMLLKYIEKLEQEGFISYVVTTNDDHIEDRVLIREDTWVWISDNSMGPLKHYGIAVKRQHDLGGKISKEEASEKIGDGGTGEKLLAIREITPDSFGKDCCMQVFTCLFGNKPNNINQRTFLVGSKSIYELGAYAGVARISSDAWSDDIIILQEGDLDGVPYFVLRRTYEQNGDPATNWGNKFYLHMYDRGRISLTEQNGKVFFVFTRRKSYMGKPYNPYKHPLQYEEPKTYEIMITSRGFSIDDPKNNLGILFVMDADKETWELGS